MNGTQEEEYCNAYDRLAVWESHNMTPTVEEAIITAQDVLSRESEHTLNQAGYPTASAVLLHAEAILTEEAGYEPVWDTAIYNTLLMLRSVMKKEGIVRHA